MTFHAYTFKNTILLVLKIRFKLYEVQLTELVNDIHMRIPDKFPVARRKKTQAKIKHSTAWHMYPVALFIFDIKAWIFFYGLWHFSHYLIKFCSIAFQK